MYRAFTERDSSFEGIFFVAVKTTGIFCRPTCTARKPKRENIEYFSTQSEALLAGYRPCKRCRPMDAASNRPELIDRLMEAVEQTPARRISDGDLREMGIDPSTARRQFQRFFGMTFQAYQRARRMGLALHEIRAGQPVIEAQLNQGFSSASGFWETFKHVFGAPPSQSHGVNVLQAKWIDTPLGAMLALADQSSLYLLEFVDRRALENEVLALRRRTHSYIVPGESPVLDQISTELEEYYSGKSLAFNTPMALVGSPVEQSAWELLQTIPPGQTRSYGWMAEKLNKPGAARAVGQANGRNHLAIIVPCHRVIRSDGSLSGYGGGIWRKKWLLEHERGHLPDPEYTI
jgi:AraC family transcriptional regulator of adaptative response/methylated-DNA-[protein]-cysteine methyltransferase